MKKFLSLLLALTMLFTFVACSSSGEEEQSDPAQDQQQSGESGGEAAGAEKTTVDIIKEKGKIVLGTSADYPPFEYHMMVDGKDTIVGFDIEIAKLIAAKLGVELEITDMAFDALLMSLQAGQFDMVIAGLTYSPDRYGLFSDPYLTEGQAVLIHVDNKDVLKTEADLMGKGVGAQKGTVQANLAKAVTDADKVLELVKFPDLVMELKGKKIDAVVVDAAVASDYLEANPDLIDSGIILEDGLVHKCVAVQEGNDALIAVINEVIAAGLADGSFDALMAEANSNAQYEIKPAA
ncbi:MAG: transporter substrate-binding domain-containing protein [Clostridia bacterium]|nr:transporter substrate-binding domain-containing protein [Clostridia bacterium]